MKVICTNPIGILKAGETYEVFEGTEEFYTILDSYGAPRTFNKSRFVPVFENRQEEIIKLAVKTFGLDQLDILQEEAAELIQAISKYKRYAKGDKLSSEVAINNVIEEIADVEIMLEQTKILLDIKDNQLKDCKEYKIKRLEKNIYSSKIERCVFDE